MMLVYNNRIIHLRGRPSAISALLDAIEIDDVEIQAVPQHKASILEKFKPTTLNTEILTMTLNTDQAQLQISHPIRALDASDARQIAELLKDADPQIWGETTSQQITKRIPYVTWVGIRLQQQLVALSGYWTTDWIGCIGATATHRNHRKKGYATSLVSHALQQIRKKRDKAMLFVRTNNPSALSIYQKVGFKPIQIYFLMRGTRR